MAAKPIQIYTFATDLNFGTGPATGSPTKIVPASPLQGFIPGTGIAAEHVNYLFNITGQWITDWLDLGSSLPGLDAHLVETDSLGVAELAGLEVGGTAGVFVPLSVQSNAAVLTSATITNSNVNGTGLIVSANTSGGGGKAARIANLGTDIGLEVSSAGDGLDVVAGAGPGIGNGITAEGRGAGGVGGTFFASGILGANHGVVCTASGDGAGGVFTAELAGTEPPISANFSVGGISVRGSIFLNPTVNTPSAPLDGDVWKKPGSIAGRGGLEWQDDDGAVGGGGPGKQRAWSTTNGFGHEYVESLGDTTESVGLPTIKVTAFIGTVPPPTHPDGDYIVEFSGMIRLAPGALVSTLARIQFFAGPSGAPVFITQEIAHFASNNQNQSFYFKHKSTLPFGGPAQEFRISFDSLTGAGNGVTISQAKIEARGAYE